MASPAVSGRWCGFTREAKVRSHQKRLATLAAKHAPVSDAHTAILHACDVDRVLRLRSEADIKLEQEAKIAAYFTRKRTVWMAAALTLLCLWPALASAQTIFSNQGSAAQTIVTPLPDDLRFGWDHDSLNLGSFLIIVDGTRFDLGRPKPTLNTSYQVVLPVGAVQLLRTVGTHKVVMVARTPAGRDTESEPLNVVVQEPTPENTPRASQPFNLRVIISISVEPK